MTTSEYGEMERIMLIKEIVDHELQSSAQVSVVLAKARINAEVKIAFVGLHHCLHYSRVLIRVEKLD